MSLYLSVRHTLPRLATAGMMSCYQKTQKIRKRSGGATIISRILKYRTGRISTKIIKRLY